jgi:hypothetical protein
VEKYTFWIATRALVFGVPFLVVAYFAQENFSGYNDARPAAFEYPSEIKEWSPGAVWSPFWRKIASRKDEVAQFLWDKCKVTIPEKVRQSDLQELKDLKLTTTPVDMSVAFKAFSILNEESLKKKLSFPYSWWSLAEFSGEKLFASNIANTEDIYVYVNLQRQLWDLRTAMLLALNEKLKRPDLYATFTPDVIRGNPELSRRKQEAAEVSRSNQIAASDEVAILNVNRQLLTEYSDGDVRPKSVVFSGVVLAQDQDYRFKWFLWSGALFVVSAIFINLNATSLHGFYANRLAYMWIEPWHGENREYPL